MAKKSNIDMDEQFDTFMKEASLGAFIYSLGSMDWYNISSFALSCFFIDLNLQNICSQSISSEDSSFEPSQHGRYFPEGKNKKKEKPWWSYHDADDDDDIGV